MNGREHSSDEAPRGAKPRLRCRRCANLIALFNLLVLPADDLLFYPSNRASANSESVRKGAFFHSRVNRAARER